MILDRFKEGISILEALSATGLRSIRYAKEVPYVKHIIANDISATAVESIKKNVLHNDVNNLVSTSHNDATLVTFTLIEFISTRKIFQNYFIHFLLSFLFIGWSCMSTEKIVLMPST